MDITRFLNSRAIAEHLRTINYQFSLPEAAYLIYNCSTATLDQKIEAWESLIETFPDCSMDKRLHLEPITSFHTFLYQYIDFTKENL